MQSLPVQFFVRVQVVSQCSAAQRDARKNTARPRPFYNLRSQFGVGLRGARTSNGSRRYFRTTAQRELTLQKPIHPLLIHDQHNDVSLRAAYLPSDAAAFDPHSRGSSPTGIISFPANNETLAILASDYEGRLLHTRHDNDTVSVFKQILRDTLVGGLHHF